MTKRRLIDEEDEWKIKKVINRIETNRRSPFFYLFNQRANSSKPLNTIYENAYKKRNSSEVVVKITSNSKNLKTLKAHLDYISRNGNIELLSSDELVYSGIKEVGEIRDIYRDEGAPIQKKTKAGQREYRETYNMVFSFKEADGEVVKKAAFKTIKEKYPDNFFVAAVHTDTNHSHCHVCLKVKNSAGKRVDIKKQNLAEIRKEFAQNLRDLGILATAARKTKPAVSHKEKGNKQHFYEITGWGHAPYKHIEGNKQTGYVKYLTTKGEEITLYGDDILRAVQTSGVKIGQKARLKVAGKKEVIVKQ